eukprot:Lithocolla_globosa_v1_NODE_4168_length_1495_cov_28.507639.p1 type:complete len:466 gc:universal NODE_4168_length_1495_cov_28.507639:1415-18(-)
MDDDPFSENPFADVPVSEPASTPAQSAEEASAPAVVKEPEAVASVSEDAAVVEATQEPATAAVIPAEAVTVTPVDGESFAEVALKKPVESNFQLEFAEAIKKGEGMSAFIVYPITTKTKLANYKKSEMSVQRRFNHFVWLHTELEKKYPGVIIPPLPDKQTLTTGKFGEDFLSTRKHHLEVCLKKICAHQDLCNSPDLQFFLETEDFDGALEAKKKATKKGFFSAMSSAISDAATSATVTFGKMPESDPWFDQKKAQMDTFEVQLKGVAKALELLIKQRKDLASSAGEFGETVESLAKSEYNKPLQASLEHLSSIQKGVQKSHSEQATDDVTKFVPIVDEYLRLMVSVRAANQSRVKKYFEWQDTEKQLVSKRAAYEKAKANPKQASKLPALEKEVSEAETSVAASKKAFEEVSALLKKEYERYDDEKAHDFKNTLVHYLESMIHMQEKIIKLWEDYLPEVEALA